jgi:hypothetical protein
VTERKRRSDRMIGDKNPAKRKDVQEKIRLAGIGRVPSKESREKSTKTRHLRFPKWCSNPEERARRMSIATKGKKKPKLSIALKKLFSEHPEIHRRSGEKQRGVKRGQMDPEMVKRRIKTRQERGYYKNPTEHTEIMRRVRNELISSGKWVPSHKSGRGLKGAFWSDKNQKTFLYKSSWELAAMRIFEQQDFILRYEYEVLSISWVDKDNKKHHTFPDFLIYNKDGSRQIIEVKPQYRIDKNVDSTNEKIKASKEYAEQNGMKFLVWTEKELNIN